MKLLFLWAKAWFIDQLKVSAEKFSLQFPLILLRFKLHSHWRRFLAISSQKRKKRDIWLPGVNFTNILTAFSYKSFFVQLLCAYNLGLYFFGERILAQKLLIKCWRNWHQGSVASSLRIQIASSHFLKRNETLPIFFLFFLLGQQNFLV